MIDAVGEGAPERRMRRLIIFAKYPRAGEAKTRLVPPLTFEDAAELAGSFLRDLLLATAPLAHAVERHLLVGAERDLQAMRDLLEDQCPGEDVISMRPQRGDGLGERLLRAFDDAFEEGCREVVIVGSDHPTLPPRAFDEAFELLARHDLVIVPAEDGGYCLIGLRRPAEALFRLASFSTPELLAQTLDAARDAGLSVATLPTWYDVDDAFTLERLWRERYLLPPGSRTASILARTYESLRGSLHGEIEGR